MAKQKAKAPSIHSRAARRATSPSINTDKSLKDVKPPSESVNNRPSVLGIHQSAGVSKKVKRGRKSVLSTKARKRHTRGLERAEEIVDRTALKVQKSKLSAVGIEARKKGWDDVNGSAAAAKAAAEAARKAASTNKFAGLETGGDDDGDDTEEVDEFDDEMGDAAAAAPAVAAPVDEDEEIL